MFDGLQGIVVALVIMAEGKTTLHDVATDAKMCLHQCMVARDTKEGMTPVDGVVTALVPLLDLYILSSSGLHMKCSRFPLSRPSPPAHAAASYGGRCRQANDKRSCRRRLFSSCFHLPQRCRTMTCIHTALLGRTRGSHAALSFFLFFCINFPQSAAPGHAADVPIIFVRIVKRERAIFCLHTFTKPIIQLPHHSPNL